MVLIFVIGHAINIFMNVLGAMVHPMRLTFVEFFKNSGYEVGGKEYKPVSYTHLICKTRFESWPIRFIVKAWKKETRKRRDLSRMLRKKLRKSLRMPEKLSLIHISHN